MLSNSLFNDIVDLGGDKKNASEKKNHFMEQIFGQVATLGCIHVVMYFLHIARIGQDKGHSNKKSSRTKFTSDCNGYK